MEATRLAAAASQPDDAVAPGRVVLHVDMDAFYAAVEARDDPRLRGIPLVVGADPRGGRGRGVVCTASYEARRFGLRSAMPISVAYRLAPHAVFVAPDFPKYSEASATVMAVLGRYADALQVVGLDEAYLDITERVSEAGTPDWDLVRSIAHSLQAAVKRATGLSCSVGAAPNKSAAKVASDRRKPHGVTVVEPGALPAFLAPLPPGKLGGCGPKTAAALRDAGITTIGELAATPLPHLEAIFGANGAWLWHIARGDDPRPVDPSSRERKSRGAESTYFADEADGREVLGTAASLLAELLQGHARRDRRPYATLTVKLRYADFRTFTRSHSVQVPLEAGDQDCDREAQRIVASLLAPNLGTSPVRLVGVRLSGFAGESGQQRLARFGVDWSAGLATPALHAPALTQPGLQPSGPALRRTNLGHFREAAKAAS